MMFPRRPHRSHWFMLPAALLLTLLAAAAATPDAKKLDEAFGRSELHIATPDAKLHRFQVWIADTDRRRERGLMFVDHMAADAGMLFIYPDSQRISMWMKNTHIPLDMLFVARDGRVARVVANTTPMSLATIESGEDVNAVIELNAGTAARLNITAGAQVIHPAFSKR
jgi:uncharacterized protein